MYDTPQQHVGGVTDIQLDYYLPLPGLLDPHLDAIIPPFLDKLAGVVGRLASGDGSIDQTRLNRLGEVINWVIKVRGWKVTGGCLFCSARLADQQYSISPLESISSLSSSTCYPLLLAPAARSPRLLLTTL